jgi:transcriptional regulator with XRE-family HTH domain
MTALSVSTVTPDPLVAALKARRIQLGLTQATLASRLNVIRATVSWLESGRNSPTLATLRRWAQALGWDLYTAPKLDPRGRRGVPAHRPCGSLASARRHYHRGEPLDDACRAAQRHYDRDRKRAIAAQRKADAR